MNYPDQIEKTNLTIADINQQIQVCKDDLEVVDNNIINGVLTATNEDNKPKYSNDKACEIAIADRRHVNQAYRDILANVRSLEFAKAVELARLERLRGEFRESLIEKMRAKDFFVAELA